MQRENSEQVLLQDRRKGIQLSDRNPFTSANVSLPSFPEEVPFQDMDCKMAYNANTETRKLANSLYFQLLRQYFLRGEVTSSGETRASY